MEGSPVTDPFFKGGRQGTFILLSILGAKLTIRVVFSVRTQISQRY